jgi:hypothetical protein
MEAIYFDNGSSAFKVTKNNCVVVTYNEYNDKTIGVQPRNSFSYLLKYGHNRITQAEFENKAMQVLNELQLLTINK